MASNVVLGVGVHDDDIEFTSSGTVAKLIQQGSTVYYLILTDGSKGTEDLSLSADKLTEIRIKEQQKAAQVLGVKQVFFLSHVDGELQNTPDLKKEIVRIIRTLKPNTVICWDPTFVYDLEWGFINHSDHRVSGQATLDAVFPFARNARTFPELLEEEDLKPHSVMEILMINMVNQNYFVDISDVFDTKLKALKCHTSQFKDFAIPKALVTERAKIIGKKAGYPLAEGFLRIKMRS